MIQEGRFSDVLSESQIARMNGNKEGRNAGIAEGLRMAAEILHNPKVRHDFYQQIISKAKEIEESAK